MNNDSAKKTKVFVVGLFEISLVVQNKTRFSILRQD